MLGRKPVQHQPGIKRNNMVPNPTRTKRTARTGRKTEGGGHGPAATISPPAQQGRPQSILVTKSLRRLFCTTAQGAGGLVGWVRAGRRCSSAAGCASCGRTMRSCACARDHLPMGSTPADRFGERWAWCLPRAWRRRRHGGRRRTSLPIPGRVPISGTPAGVTAERVRPLGGRQRHRSGMQPAHRGGEEGPGSSWPASFRTRPPARASGRSWTCSRRCRPARASASRTTTAPSSPTTKGCATGWACHVLRRPVLQLAAGSSGTTTA